MARQIAEDTEDTVTKRRSPIVSIVNVSKTFGEGERQIKALDQVSCGINDYEFVSIIGPSGCGKSTLLRILAGLIPYEEGEVLIKGEKVVKPMDDVGVVFQTSNLMPWLNVEANLRLGLEIKGKVTDATPEMMAGMISTLGLSEFEKSYPHELSGGMQQRVALGQVLMCNPQVLLMDEPFGALDALTRDRLNIELLRIWQAEQKTVILVTHGIAEAVLLSDRVLVLSDRPGRLAAEVSIGLDRPCEPSRTRSDPRFGDYVVQLSEIMGVS